ncbi:hypothetical protein SNOG_15314 [Parastagonospora nodorum SN15]|uniref:Uncharacterized protein n=1 Tax=Phaeosphaeria nodorum (strain SN15 / ATCC MYA-4574 / FGSC 10173) TaxID=321614 RepID=Q0TYP3_PHANO|nr:hypothetical protein SNOG_15314 [Parastagonospora nodorum SN15]EAT77247.1 hypothetical protein SNOG_15314 [Parastagonospora nodorum SN15]
MTWLQVQFKKPIRSCMSAFNVVTQQSRIERSAQLGLKHLSQLELILCAVSPVNTASSAFLQTGLAVLLRA